MILNSKMPSLLDNNYNPAFKLSLMCKDLDIITGAAKTLGSPTPVASIVEQVFNLCKDKHGEKDAIAVSLFYQEQTGVSLGSKNKL